MRHFRRARGDEGAAAVEFALLFPIFILLTIGTITTGTAFSRQINLTQAAREASRFGATYDVQTAGNLSTWLQKVDDALCLSMNNGNACSSSQASNPLAGYDYRCVALITRASDGSVDQARTAYKTDGGAASLNQSGGCPGVTTPNLGAKTTAVQVVLSRDIKFFIIFANPALHLDAVSLTPYEGRPA